MILGYNTNGFAHHAPPDAAAILAEIGYRCVALTPDVHHLNPYDAATPREADRLGEWLRPHGTACVIETGARFLLDPRRKHQPTLLSADPQQRRRRIDFLARCIDLAKALGADVVSLWSGAADDSASPGELWDRLTSGVRVVLDHAGRAGVRLAFEPEPGMLVERMADFERLQEAMGDPRLGLTLDVGHVYCLDDGTVGDHVRRWRDRLWNVHIEDMRRGVHEHLPFGEGEIDVPAALDALRDVGYAGPLCVELSRHSHDAVTAARAAYEFLIALGAAGR